MKGNHLIKSCWIKAARKKVCIFFLKLYIFNFDDMIFIVFVELLNNYPPSHYRKKETRMWCWLRCDAMYHISFSNRKSVKVRCLKEIEVLKRRNKNSKLKTTLWGPGYGQKSRYVIFSKIICIFTEFILANDYIIFCANLIYLNCIFSGVEGTIFCLLKAKKVDGISYAKGKTFIRVQKKEYVFSDWISDANLLAKVDRLRQSKSKDSPSDTVFQRLKKAFIEAKSKASTLQTMSGTVNQLLKMYCICRLSNSPDMFLCLLLIYSKIFFILVQETTSWCPRRSLTSKGKSGSWAKMTWTRKARTVSMRNLRC